MSYTQAERDSLSDDDIEETFSFLEAKILLAERIANKKK
jgi:hypothetical protein